MSADNHTILVQRYIDEVWNGGQSATLFFAPHYKRYVTAIAVPLSGAEQQRIMSFQRAFPDLHFSIDDLLADGDRVVFRATMRGTHLGRFRTIVPTGKHVTVAVLDVVRVEQGLFVEHWGGPDPFDLLQQLGAVMSVRTTEQAVE